MYLIGARVGHPDMIWWIVSDLFLHALHVSSIVVLWMCFLVYLVVMAFSWIAQMVDSVVLLSVDERSQDSDAFLSI